MASYLSDLLKQVKKVYPNFIADEDEWASHTDGYDSEEIRKALNYYNLHISKTIPPEPTEFRYYLKCADIVMMSDKEVTDYLRRM